MAAPLMFSFLEREGSQSIAMRVGTGLHPDGKATWCRHFYVQARIITYHSVLSG